MGQPTPSDVHVDAALTDMSIAIIQQSTNFVAGGVPTKPVKNQTNKYHVFTPGDFHRDDAVKQRAPSTEAPRSGFTLSQDSYSAEAWWTSTPIDEMLRANADPAIPLDRAAMELVTSRLLIRRERLYATAFLNTDGVWTGGEVTGSTDFTQWSDAASDPQQDVLAGKKAILLATGLEPNRLEVSYDVHIALKRHPLIRDQFKYTSAQSITPEMIAAFFELETYSVCKAIYNTAKEGATESNAFVVGKHGLLTYLDPSPSIMAPTAITTFVWSGLTGVNDAGVRMDQFYDIKTKEDVIRGEFALDMKVTGPKLGYRFKSAVA